MELNDKKSTGPGIEAEIEVRVETVTVIESTGPVRTPDNEIRRSLQAGLNGSAAPTVLKEIPDSGYQEQGKKSGATTASP